MKKIGRALVVANGEPLSPGRLRAAVEAADFILAADGGANALISVGIVPHAVLGDFDSLSVPLPDSVERIEAVDQNFTDLDKAVSYLIERGAERITLAGATGNRLDHTFGSLSVLAKYGRRAKLTLIDDIGVALLVDNQISFLATPNQIISLLPLGAIENITTIGLKWNLAGEPLAPGIRDGTSNIATEKKVTISVGAGDLIVYVHYPA